MANYDLNEKLANNTYPGRGIVIGLTPDGNNIAMAYFTMGRSVNSRNRIFIEDGEGIMNKAFDPSKMVDPSLIIYAPIRVLCNTTVVTNGDQTDTVYDYLKEGKTFEEALTTRTFEPDPPNFTPRISGIITVEDGTATYQLSILKSMDGNPDSVCRYFFHYDQPLAGVGHFIHTYQCDGNPIPSFAGEPERVDIENDFDVFSDHVWKNLNEDNKVSLVTRFISVKDGSVQQKIYNKLG